MVYFRTDANERVASGHIMRCMTIATELTRLGVEVKFIIKDTTSSFFLEDKFNYVQIVSDDIDTILAIISVDDCPVVFFDSYEFKADYMDQIRKYARIVTFDDMFAEKYPVDILINYNLYAHIFDYNGRYDSENIILLLGGNYVPLRENFKGQYGVDSEKVNNVLLISGGGDKEHVLVNMLDHILGNGLNKKYQFHIVAGRLNTDIDTLKSKAENTDVIVYSNVNDMPSLLKKMDVVISAASTVLYECCKMGVATIFYCMADNQQNDIKSFSENGTMLFAGDVRNDMEGTCKNALSLLNDISDDYEKRKTMSMKSKILIDGNGAKRIAQAIIDLMGRDR